MGLKDGQQVIIRNPGTLVGTVVSVRPADKNLPEEKKLYFVKIAEQERLFRSTSLEAVAESKGDVLEWYSAEWLEELNRTAEIAQRLQQDKNNPELIRQLIDSGSKLGLIVPIK